MTREIQLIVTVQIDSDNENLDPICVERSAREAIENAIGTVGDAGFSHDLAYEMSIGLVAVEVKS